ncbi:MAG TPA: ribonuclease Z [Cyclobacteriaceae bacterium]|nr:ribonuclease Z [Cyclobacteriaceae bacterium]
MSFKVTILGSSGAVPAYGRFPSSQLIEIQNRNFLVDCGEGCQMQMMRYQVNFHRVSHIFISHLHGDHYLGLMGLIFTMHLQHRTNDLHIFGHRGLDEIITTQFRYSRSAPGFKIHFHELDKDQRATIYDDEALTVETLPFDHHIPCTGFVFREKIKPRRIDKTKLPEGLSIQQLAGLKHGLDVTDGDGNVIYKNDTLTIDPKPSRSYAYCSDTGYDERIIPVIKGIDLLYHEATFSLDEESKARETLHSTAHHAAVIAEKANVKKLLLGHFSARYKELETLLQEARVTFTNSFLAREGETFVVEE